MIKVKPYVFTFIFFFLLAGFSFAEDNPEGEVQKIVSGSNLLVQVYQEPDLSGKYVVSEEGILYFPLIEKIQADGLTLDQLRTKLVQELKRFIVNPHVTVQLSEEKGGVSSQRTTVLIFGEVRQQGAQEVPPDGTTLLHVLALSGGFSDVANPGRVHVVSMSDGKKITRYVNVGDILTGRREDLVVHRGDVVFVPESFF